jgi:hypothetical protein
MLLHSQYIHHYVLILCIQIFEVLRENTIEIECGTDTGHMSERLREIS